MIPRYVLEEWAPGPHASGWKQLGDETTDARSATATMQHIAEGDVQAYGPHGYLRLRVRETTGGAA